MKLAIWLIAIALWVEVILKLYGFLSLKIKERRLKKNKWLI